MNGRGGKRVGAGRPKGSFKPVSNQRKQRQLRAFDDEWLLIDKFAKFVKYGDKTKCANFIDSLETK